MWRRSARRSRSRAWSNLSILPARACASVSGGVAGVSFRFAVAVRVFGRRGACACRGAVTWIDGSAVAPSSVACAASCADAEPLILQRTIVAAPKAAVMDFNDADIVLIPIRRPNPLRIRRAPAAAMRRTDGLCRTPPQTSAALMRAGYRLIVVRRREERAAGRRRRRISDEGIRRRSRGKKFEGLRQQQDGRRRDQGCAGHGHDDADRAGVGGVPVVILLVVILAGG